MYMASTDLSFAHFLRNSQKLHRTSSRNSEVIHAGLYYPVDSLKTKLCIRGNELMYDFCEKYNIEHRQTTKWVVGQNEADLEYLEGLSKKAQELLLPTKRMPGLPTFMLTQEQMLELEPNVQGKAAMVSSRTGIVDVHGLMGVLEARIQDHGGHVILQCEVTEIERIHPNVMTGRDADCDNGDLSSFGGGGFRVKMETPVGPAVVNAATVINSAGLPKLAGPGEPFHDFIIHHHGGFVNLAGIESPGLTSSLAIAEYVEGMLY
ncbi:hypothetical protein BGZ58_007309 [Dissophora ornata]|nr:hypothetical protein BGZ58_007309 [Dissophora ornata]